MVISHRIHWTGIFTYIYHKKSTIHVGKYTSPMDPMGCGVLSISGVKLLVSSITSGPRKKPSYFPLNPGWLKTGSLCHGLL